MSAADKLAIIITKMKKAGTFPRPAVFRRMADGDQRLIDFVIEAGLHEVADELSEATRVRRDSRAEYQRERKQRVQDDKAYAARHGIPVDKVSSHKIAAHWRAAAQCLDEMALNKAVELLDIWVVGEKLLGDCTKRDLINACGEAREHSSHLLANADLYEQLSSLLKPNEIVRTSGRREEIVRIIRGRLPAQESVG